jgi:hypothetical protein
LWKVEGRGEGGRGGEEGIRRGGEYGDNGLVRPGGASGSRGSGRGKGGGAVMEDDSLKAISCLSVWQTGRMSACAPFRWVSHGIKNAFFPFLYGFPSSSSIPAGSPSPTPRPPQNKSNGFPLAGAGRAGGGEGGRAGGDRKGFMCPCGDDGGGRVDGCCCCCNPKAGTGMDMDEISLSHGPPERGWEGGREGGREGGKDGACVPGSLAMWWKSVCRSDPLGRVMV